jgi:predicted O-methyltransferase YrrM
LEGKISKDNHRYDTFAAALKLMTQRGVRTIVETGTARGGLNNCSGDGCSTPIFGQWAKDHGAVLYSVDIDPEAIQNAAQAVSTISENIRFITGDSVDFLAKFNGNIDFLYLDSYNFECFNPSPSQLHHLKEIVAAYPFLTPNSVVMIDDCGLPFGGKGKMVIEYLTARGWTPFKIGYQIIFVTSQSLQ